MKSTLGLAAMATVLIWIAAGCAKSDEDMQPATGNTGAREAVQGRWLIERVNNRLCRSGNCTTVVYKGTAGDFFEFKADSAFLQRTSLQNSSSVYRDKFKAEYLQSSSFMLSNFGWSAKFRVIHQDQRNLVLEGTYSGYDPNAQFTDTYFLYR